MKTTSNLSNFITNLKTYKLNFLKIALILLTFKMITSATIYFDLPKNVQNIMILIAYIFLALEFITKNTNIKKIIISGLLLGVSIYTSYVIKNYWYLTTILLIINIDKDNLRQSIKTIFKIELVITIITIIFSLIMLSLNVTEDLYTLRRGGSYFNFGFLNVNVFSSIINNLIIIAIWLYYEKLHNIYFVLIFAIQTILYYITNTRTLYLVSILLLLMLILDKNIKRKKFRKILGLILNILSKYLYIVIGVIMYIIVYKYTFSNERSRLVLAIDDILTGRIHYGGYGLLHYGNTFLGQFIKYGNVTWEKVWHVTNFTFDSMYTMLFFNIGIFWYLLLVFSFIRLNKYLDNKDKIVLIFWYLYGITEVIGLNAIFGIQILFISLLLSDLRGKHNIRLIKK
ncbi:MAG: hypothetical protein ACTTGJ_04165 [Clostridium sp.]